MKEIRMNYNNKDRSDKNCCCGGHNVKKNKNHNSTKNKLNIRKSRRFKNNMKEF